MSFYLFLVNIAFYYYLVTLLTLINCFTLKPSLFNTNIITSTIFGLLTLLHILFYFVLFEFSCIFVFRCISNKQHITSFFFLICLLLFLYNYVCLGRGREKESGFICFSERVMFGFWSVVSLLQSK